MSVDNFAIIMPWGRVGSNLVVSVLGQNCRVSIANEPTTGIRSRNRDLRSSFAVDRDQLAYLRGFPDQKAIGPASRKLPLRGVKLSHRSFVSPMSAYAVLREKGFRIVAMDRDNHLKTAISQIRAEQRAKAGDQPGAWSVPRDAAAPGASTIPPDLALRRARAFAGASAQMHDYLAHFFGDDLLKIRYEDLNVDPKPVIFSIARYLGLDLDKGFDLPHQKATDDDLSRSVSNWDEVRAVFADSEFAAYLD